MSTGPKLENRGGARAGAGRKKGSGQTLSARQVRAMLRKAREYAIKHGKTIDELLLDWIYGADGESTPRLEHRIACVKLWKEYTIAKLQEGGEVDRSLAGPAIFLPEQRPRLEPVKTDKAA
jgi:hypothetical protein